MWGLDYHLCIGAQLTRARGCRMHKDWRKGIAGRVYSVSSGTSAPAQIMADDVITLPNGMAWDMARRVMYFADTGSSAIFACASRALPHSAASSAHSRRCALYQTQASPLEGQLHVQGVRFGTQSPIGTALTPMACLSLALRGRLWFPSPRMPPTGHLTASPSTATATSGQRSRKQAPSSATAPQVGPPMTVGISWICKWGLGVRDAV